MQSKTIRILLEEISEDLNLVALILSVVSFLALSYFSLPLWITYLPYVLVIVYYLYRLYRRIQIVTLDKHLPAIFVAGEQEINREQLLNQAEDAIKRNTHFSKFNILEKYFLVSLWGAVYWRKTPSNENEWMDYMEDGIERIKWLYDKVKGRKIYHLFFGRPAVMALGLGAILGRWDKPPVIVYQWMGNEYKPVLDLSKEPRKVKVKIDLNKEKFRYIKVEFPEKLGEKVALVLEMASHPIREDVIRYVSTWSEKIEIIVVENTYGGDLRDEDWTRPVQELYNLIAELKNRRVEEFHLFISMPEAMAFGLGYALGPYWNVKVYNLMREKKTYKLAFSLNKLPESSIE